MARAGVDKQAILLCAAEIVDSEGTDALLLKTIAERLHIRPPSLYSHIKSLEDLRYQLSLYGMEQLRDVLFKAALGRSGNDAVREMGYAYIRFAREHPGLYATFQWMNIWEDPNKKKVFMGVVELISRIYSEYGLDEIESSHLVRMFRCLIHGFAVMECHNSFGHPSSVEDTFDRALDITLKGIAMKYGINTEVIS
jgi:AcrR family transcriptional regulator